MSDPGVQHSMMAVLCSTVALPGGRLEQDMGPSRFHFVHNNLIWFFSTLLESEAPVDPPTIPHRV